MDRIEAAIAASRIEEVAGYHKLRGRRAGARRYVDLHVQFRSGTSLEQAHELAHQMRDAIEAAVPRAEVLIHVEPETSLREPDDSRMGPTGRARAGGARQRVLSSGWGGLLALRASSGAGIQRT